jgi:drug/metabolite transporter (DMT)-like permease
MALNFISASAYQMLRGGAIITTFIFSFLFFKATIHRPQVIGTILAFLGILVVGLANILHIGPAEAGTDGVIVSFILEFINCRIYLDNCVFGDKWAIFCL